jgi:hypothetical protein
MGRMLLVGGLIVLAGCVGSIDGSGLDQEPIESPGPDAGPPVTPPGPDAAVPQVGAVAPAGAVPGERHLADGANAVTLEPAGVAYRLEAEAGQHVAFVLSFAGASGVAMAADRWTGSEVVELGVTNAGPGLRFLSVLDRDERRTYWVRLRAQATAQATLTVTRTPFPDGPSCAADCARLIQMPLPNDPAVDGYDTDGGTHFRYWFGRRDLVMMVRHAARARADSGQAPFFPYDFSQWDGQTPGADTGSLRHASHQRGKDVDISLYGLDGAAPWRSYCQTTYVSGKRECIPGTRRNFDGYQNALVFASHLVSGRVTMSFLDRELIPTLVDGARRGGTEGLIGGSLLPLYSNGRHVQHWPFHDNHIHIRVSETAYGARVDLDAEPFEAP